MPAYDLDPNVDTKNLVKYKDYKKFNLFAMEYLEAPFNFSLTL